MGFAAGLVAVIFTLFVLLVLMISSNNMKNTMNNENIVSYPTSAPVKSIVSYLTGDYPPMPAGEAPLPNPPVTNPNPVNPITGTISGYVSAPVTMVNCNSDEDTLVDVYYSLCYPKGYSVVQGTRSLQGNDKHYAIYSTTDSLPFVIQRIDGKDALYRLPYLNPNPYRFEYKSIDTIGNGMYDYDRKLNASNMSMPETGKFRGILDSFTFTSEQNSIRTFSEQISLQIPVQNIPSKVLIFIQGDSNFILIYEDTSTNQRIVDSLVFNR